MEDTVFSPHVPSASTAAAVVTSVSTVTAAAAAATGSPAPLPRFPLLYRAGDSTSTAVAIHEMVPAALAHDPDIDPGSLLPPQIRQAVLQHQLNAMVHHRDTGEWPEWHAVPFKICHRIQTKAASLPAHALPPLLEVGDWQVRVT
jgi:hypothetical protein